jgi:AcrR family transcriptional regulator
MGVYQDKRDQTTQRFEQALINLCTEKNYYAITITDICRKAGMNRSSFYRYYTDKTSLLRSMENSIIKQSQKRMNSFSIHLDEDADNGYHRLKQSLIANLQNMENNRELYTFLLSPSGDPHFRRNLIESFTKRYTTYLKNMRGKVTKEEKYSIYFFAAGFTASRYRWLLNHDLSVEKMAETLTSLLVNFTNFLSDPDPFLPPQR